MSVYEILRTAYDKVSCNCRPNCSEVTEYIILLELLNINPGNLPIFCKTYYYMNVNKDRIEKYAKHHLKLKDLTEEILLIYSVHSM